MMFLTEEQQQQQQSCFLSSVRAKRNMSLPHSSRGLKLQASPPQTPPRPATHPSPARGATFHHHTHHHIQNQSLMSPRGVVVAVSATSHSPDTSIIRNNNYNNSHQVPSLQGIPLRDLKECFLLFSPQAHFYTGRDLLSSVSAARQFTIERSDCLTILESFGFQISKLDRKHLHEYFPEKVTFENLTRFVEERQLERLRFSTDDDATEQTMQLKESESWNSGFSSDAPTGNLDLVSSSSGLNEQKLQKQDRNTSTESLLLQTQHPDIHPLTEEQLKEFRILLNHNPQVGDKSSTENLLNFSKHLFLKMTEIHGIDLLAWKEMRKVLNVPLCRSVVASDNGNGSTFSGVLVVLQSFELIDAVPGHLWDEIMSLLTPFQCGDFLYVDARGRLNFLFVSPPSLNMSLIGVDEPLEEAILFSRAALELLSRKSVAEDSSVPLVLSVTSGDFECSEMPPRVSNQKSTLSHHSLPIVISKSISDSHETIDHYMRHVSTQKHNSGHSSSVCLLHRSTIDRAEAFCTFIPVSFAEEQYFLLGDVLNAHPPHSETHPVLGAPSHDYDFTEVAQLSKFIPKDVRLQFCEEKVHTQEQEYDSVPALVFCVSLPETPPNAFYSKQSRHSVSAGDSVLHSRRNVWSPESPLTPGPASSVSPSSPFIGSKSIYQSLGHSTSIRLNNCLQQIGDIVQFFKGIIFSVQHLDSSLFFTISMKSSTKTNESLSLVKLAQELIAGISRFSFSCSAAIARSKCFKGLHCSASGCSKHLYSLHGRATILCYQLLQELKKYPEQKHGIICDSSVRKSVGSSFRFQSLPTLYFTPFGFVPSHSGEHTKSRLICEPYTVADYTHGAHAVGSLETQNQTDVFFKLDSIMKEYLRGNTKGDLILLSSSFEYWSGSKLILSKLSATARSMAQTSNPPTVVLEGSFLHPDSKFVPFSLWQSVFAHIFRPLSESYLFGVSSQAFFREKDLPYASLLNDILGTQFTETTEASQVTGRWRIFKILQVLTNVIDLWIQRGSSGKTVLIFQNIHLADELSLHLLEALRIQTSDLLIIGSVLKSGNGLAEWIPPNLSQQYQLFELHESTPFSTTRIKKILINQVLNTRPSRQNSIVEVDDSLLSLLQSLKSTSIEFLNELIAWMISQGYIKYTEQEEKLPRQYIVKLGESPAPIAALPTSIPQLFSLILKTIDPKELMILEYASICGEQFDLDVLNTSFSPDSAERNLIDYVLSRFCSQYDMQHTNQTGILLLEKIGDGVFQFRYPCIRNLLLGKTLSKSQISIIHQRLSSFFSEKLESLLLDDEYNDSVTVSMRRHSSLGSEETSFYLDKDRKSYAYTNNPPTAHHQVALCYSKLAHHSVSALREYPELLHNSSLVEQTIKNLHEAAAALSENHLLNSAETHLRDALDLISMVPNDQLTSLHVSVLYALFTIIRLNFENKPGILLHVPTAKYDSAVVLLLRAWEFVNPSHPLYFDILWNLWNCLQDGTWNSPKCSTSVDQLIQCLENFSSNPTTNGEEETTYLLTQAYSLYALAVHHFHNNGLELAICKLQRALHLYDRVPQEMRESSSDFGSVDLKVRLLLLLCSTYLKWGYETKFLHYLALCKMHLEESDLDLHTQLFFHQSICDLLSLDSTQYYQQLGDFAEKCQILLKEHTSIYGGSILNPEIRINDAFQLQSHFWKEIALKQNAQLSTLKMLARGMDEKLLSNFFPRNLRGLSLRLQHAKILKVYARVSLLLLHSKQKEKEFYSQSNALVAELEEILNDSENLDRNSLILCLYVKGRIRLMFHQEEMKRAKKNTSFTRQTYEIDFALQRCAHLSRVYQWNVMYVQCSLLLVKFWKTHGASRSESIANQCLEHIKDSIAHHRNVLSGEDSEQLRFSKRMKDLCNELKSFCPPSGKTQSSRHKAPVSQYADDAMFQQLRLEYGSNLKLKRLITPFLEACKVVERKALQIGSPQRDLGYLSVTYAAGRHSRLNWQTLCEEHASIVVSFVPSAVDPWSIAHLKRLQNRYSELKALYSEVVVVSTDDSVVSLANDNGFLFPVIHDVKLSLDPVFRLKLSAKAEALYDSSLSMFTAEKRSQFQHYLSATYIIDCAEKKVVTSYLDADYRKQMRSQDIMDTVRLLFEKMRMGPKD